VESRPSTPPLPSFSHHPAPQTGSGTPPRVPERRSTKPARSSRPPFFPDEGLISPLLENVQPRAFSLGIGSCPCLAKLFLPRVSASPADIFFYPVSDFLLISEMWLIPSFLKKGSLTSPGGSPLQSWALTFADQSVFLQFLFECPLNDGPITSSPGRALVFYLWGGS